MGPRFRGIPATVLNLCGTEELTIDDDVFAIVEAERGKRSIDQLFDRMTLSRRQNAVGGFVDLQHAPHRLDVFGRIAPIARSGEIAQAEWSIERSCGGSCGSRHDLLCHEAIVAKWRLVISGDPRNSKEAVAFAERDRSPVGFRFCSRVRTQRGEWRRLVGGRTERHRTEAIRRGRVIEPRTFATAAQRLEQCLLRSCIRLDRCISRVKGLRDGAEPCKVIDLVGLHCLQKVSQLGWIVHGRGVHRDAVAESEQSKSLESLRLRRTRDTMHRVLLLEQKLREEGTVLTRNTENESSSRRQAMNDNPSQAPERSKLPNFS